MNCPTCDEPDGSHDQKKHNEHQVPRELLLEPGWQDDAHKQIVVQQRMKRERDEKTREAERLVAGRAAASADLEAFAAACLERVLEVAPQMTACCNRTNLATIETYRRAASVALIGHTHNYACDKCLDTRGGPMGHTTEECTWVPVDDSLFETREQCRGDELLAVVEAAKVLLDLKHGPRDEKYEAMKPLAWEALRSAVLLFEKR